MSLLSDEEIEALADVCRDPSGGVWPHNFAKAVQAAILSKLASAELPELPEADGMDVGVYYWPETVKTYGRQAYAQGAASQLSTEPFAYFYHDASSAEIANPFLHSTALFHKHDRREHYKNETPLYTRKEPK